MKQPSLSVLAKELADIRAQISEIDQAYDQMKAPLEEKRSAVQAKILEAMRTAGTLSTRYEDVTITRKTSKKVVVMNEFDAIESLKKQKPAWVIEAISPLALKEVEKGSLALDGVTVESKEYISVRQAKPTVQPNAA